MIVLLRFLLKKKYPQKIKINSYEKTSFEKQIKLIDKIYFIQSCTK